jgi:hypothetical protein
MGAYVIALSPDKDAAGGLMGKGYLQHRDMDFAGVLSTENSSFYY